MPNRITHLDEAVEFSGYSTLPEGATITVEGGRFVLVTPSVGISIDARYSDSVNPDTIDAGDSATVNTDTYDGGS